MTVADSRKVALGGVLTALCMVFILLASVLPAGRFGFYAMASFATAIVIIEYKASWSWAFFITSALISFFIVPDKTAILPYIFFFGPYGIIKHLIEKSGKTAVELLLKYAYFNLVLAASYILISSFVLEGISIKLPWLVIVLLLEVVFLIYDYIFTRVVFYYQDNIRPHVFKGKSGI